MTERRSRHGADRRRRRQRGRSASLIAHALLIAASLVMLYPLLWMVASSFKPEDEIFSRPR